MGRRYVEAEYTICNGPFKPAQMGSQQRNRSCENDQYWDADSVNLRLVTWFIMPDQTTYYNAFESGEIDFGTGAQSGSTASQRMTLFTTPIPQLPDLCVL